MKQIKTEDSVGMVLAFDMTQIIPGVYKDARFKKGHVVTKEDIPVLLSMGKEHIFIYEKNEDILHENEAAEVLKNLCIRDSKEFTYSEPKEGKIEITAAVDGLLKINRDELFKVNSYGQMMIATRHGNFPVKKGDKVAATRIIPLVIEKEKMDRLNNEIVGPILELKPYHSMKVGIVTTGNEIKKGLIKDEFGKVLIKKLEEYDAKIMGQVITGDDHDAIVSNILEFINNGADMVCVTGGMSVDPDDRTPLAIKDTGADIISYGAPVLPGAMFLLSYYGKKRIPVVGLPGCVMYAKRTIFDLCLPRLMCKEEISCEDLYRMGEGGLCLNCNTCTYPNCGFGKC